MSRVLSFSFSILILNKELNSIEEKNSSTKNQNFIQKFFTTLAATKMKDSLLIFITKFAKFGIIGCSGMIWDFGATYLFKEKIKINKYMANAIGFILGASNNYILNNFWTFGHHTPLSMQQYGVFIFIASIGLLLNSALIFLLHQKKGFNFYWAKALAIVLVFIWNFGANYFFTFA